MILNLNQNFKPYGDKNEIKFDYFVFSGGEPHIKILSEVETDGKVLITQRIQSFNDVGKLLVSVDALRNLGVNNIELLLPYFPAARQDRLMTNGEALTVKVYANLINALRLNRVTIFDAHSEVAPALLDNCISINNFKFLEKVVEQLPSDILLISPDGGALKKIYKVAAYLQDYEVVECSKSRDVKTGALSGFKVYADDLKGKDCLIVDDICDGGGTFIGLAKALKAKNAGKLYLAVSHGIFSKGFEKLEEDFDSIFTTNSFSSLDANPILTQINLGDGLLS